MEIKNQLVQCPQGHYYNASIHASCPICSGAAADGGVPPTGDPTAAAGGNFVRTEDPYSGSSGASQGSFARTEAPGSGGSGAAQGSFARTEAPFSAGGGGVNSSPGNFARTEAPPSAGGAGGTRESVGAFQPTMIGGDLSGGNTVEPVVGWLVCLDGTLRGSDFRIHAGYNYIGREVGDIRITGDQMISRQNHAMIAFDDEDLLFYVGPTGGRNLIKVNGKTVVNAVELHSYDVISMGSTKLMFVAFCGEHFDWKKG
ncbi:MAG: FHA domain-containing protein [Clostridiales bacterium]|nr:FHA domain-containing protein [Clostridiales bacterium]